MQKTKIVKKVAGTIVGCAVSFTTSRLLHANVPVCNKPEKAGLWIASGALGMMAAEKTEAWLDEKIDNIIDEVS